MAIHQEVTINKPPKAVYEMLTQAKKFEALGGGAAKISAKPGGAISLFDGYATGFNVELVPGKRVVQAWRAKAPLVEANTVKAPEGGWDNAGDTIADADRAALVKKIQTLLADQGYDPGPADGVDGPKTREAVKAFQRTIGAADTGSIDRNLVTALADHAGSG